MAVSKINRALDRLNRNAVMDSMEAGTDFVVCSASKSEWNAYVESENQKLRSRAMAWKDGEIVIVEYPTDKHEKFCEYLRVPFLIASRGFLDPAGASFVDFGDAPGFNPISAMVLVLNCSNDRFWLRCLTVSWGGINITR